MGDVLLLSLDGVGADDARAVLSTSENFRQLLRLAHRSRCLFPFSLKGGPL
jgi:hypothetical protein